MTAAARCESRGHIDRISLLGRLGRCLCRGATLILQVLLQVRAEVVATSAMRFLIFYLFTIASSNFLEAPVGMIMPVSGVGLAARPKRDRRRLDRLVLPVGTPAI
jgi:hypothetical protein